MWKKQMSEHWNQYIVQVWHEFNCIDRLHPPPQKKSFPHWGGEGVKILFNRLSYSIYFKLVEVSLTWYTSIYPAVVDYVCVYRGCLDLPTVGL